MPYLVSVIIPTFDAARFLPSALASVRAQTSAPFETIVVDDGSRDDTAAIVRAAHGVRYVHQEHRGVAAARNAGIAAARGDVVAFLDADDLWEPTKTELQLDVLSRRPHVGYVLCHKQDFLEPGTAAPRWIDDASLQHSTVALGPPGLLVRRAVVNQVGGFDEDLAVGEDRDWFVRAEAAGVEHVVLPDVLVRRRIHGANLTAHKSSSAATGWVRALKAHLDRARDDEVHSAG